MPWWKPSAASPAAGWPPAAPPGTPLQPPEPPFTPYVPSQSPGAMPPKRSQRRFLAAALVLVLGAGVGIALAVLLSHHRTVSSAGQNQQGTTTGPSSPTASSSALPPRQQAAQAMAALLAQSGTDRASVNQAVSSVEDCSAGLSQDKTVFSNAASSRAALLAKLAALPDGSALPATLRQDLTMAWQASGQADQDFTKWTQDEISHGCSTNDQTDANLRAATTPDEAATKYKKAFVALWMAIANQYRLPVYQYSQI
jgi:hypothetical protein